MCPFKAPKSWFLSFISVRFSSFPIGCQNSSHVSPAPQQSAQSSHVILSHLGGLLPTRHQMLGNKCTGKEQVARLF